MNDAAPPSSSSLQFDRAEFASSTPAQACAVCKAPILDTYFALGGAVLCPPCSEKLTGQSSSGGKALLRAWLWGGAVAVLGTIVWFAIGAITHMELGIVAVAVGYSVGLAVRRGSYGRGGWKYQLLAMFLTYASIVTSYVPLVIKSFADGGKKQDAAEQAKVSGKANDGTPESAAAARDAANARAAKSKEKVSAGAVSLALLVVLGVAFVSPFFGGVSNIMGLVIIAIALYEAWKLNRRVPITGPFRVGGPLEVAAPPLGTS